MIGKTNSVIGGSGGAVDEQLVNYAMLYDFGDECVDLTGGITYEKRNSATVATVTKNASDIYVSGTYSAGKNFGDVCVFTQNKVDLSDYARVMLDFKNFSLTGTLPTTGTVNAVDAYVRDIDTPSFDNSGQLSSVTKNFTATVSNQSFIMDVPISQIEQSAYVGIHTFPTATSGSTTMSFNIDGIWMVKDDNWQTWLEKGGLAIGNYASLDAVMADTEALSTLMNSKEAVDYMLKKCTGTVMASVIQSGNALKAIRESQYNAEIFANEHWCKFLEMVGESLESNKTYLYNKGDECTSVTGGWNVNLNNAPTKTASYMYFTSSSWSGVRTANNVDVSKAKKLVVEWSKHGSLGENADMQIAICKPNNFTIWSDFDANRLAYFAYGHKTVYTYANGSYKAEVDISGYVASYPSVKVVVSMYTGSANFRFDKVWIE